MNQMFDILTSRELFLLIMASVTYVVLFIVAVQNSRRKILLLQERLNKVHAMKEEQLANSMLRLELEEQKARLDYANTIAMIENEKREQAETVIFGSDVYLRMKSLLAQGRSMNDHDFVELNQVVNSVYTNFTERLYSLCKLSNHEFRVCLLVKVRVQPKDIATLTAHSKEGIATTRSRLYQKVFGKKGAEVDNWRVSYFCGVDNQGRLTGEGFDNQLRRVTQSDNGLELKGALLPDYEKMIQFVEKTHKRLFPNCGIIGWDIVIDADGNVRVVEANMTTVGIVIEQLATGDFFRDFRDEICTILKKQ